MKVDCDMCGTSGIIYSHIRFSSTKIVCPKCGGVGYVESGVCYKQNKGERK